MGKPMMIQDDDDEKIESLKKRLGAKTKVEVLRLALQSLESEVARVERIKRWQKAVQAVGKSGLAVLKDFQTPKRFAKLP